MYQTETVIVNEEPKRARSRNLSREEVLEIVVMQKNMTDAELAAYFKVHVQSIVAWKRKLRKAGWELPVKKPGRKPMDIRATGMARRKVDTLAKKIENKTTDE